MTISGMISGSAVVVALLMIVLVVVSRKAIEKNWLTSVSEKTLAERVKETPAAIVEGLRSPYFEPFRTLLC